MTLGSYSGAAVVAFLVGELLSGIKSHFMSEHHSELRDSLWQFQLHQRATCAYIWSRFTRQPAMPVLKVSKWSQRSRRLASAGSPA